MNGGNAAAAERGRLAEQAAAEFLERQGYDIRDRNYTVPRLGELDLVAWRNGCLIIAEVKARSRSESFGGLPATITPAKMRKLRRTAWHYVKVKQLMNIDVSFLAVFVKIDSAGKISNITTVPVECL